MLTSLLPVLRRADDRGSPYGPYLQLSGRLTLSC